MRIILVMTIILLYGKSTIAQTRWYFSLGSNQVTEYNTEPNFNLGFNNNSITVGGSYQDRTFGKYMAFDLQVEKRLFGTLYFVTGASMFESGYSWGGSYFSSELKNTFLGVPALIRFNYMNSHMGYFDAGLMASYLMKASLKESFNQNQASGDISPHLSRFASTFLVQVSWVLNRFVVTTYSIIKVQGTASDFSSEWQLPRNQSVFLIYWREFYFSATGIKISYRIR